LLKEFINSSQNLEADIIAMKKFTELSTMAIRLHEIYNYLNKTKLDFLKVSEKFRAHSHLIVKDLNSLLTKTNPVSFAQTLNKLRDDKNPINVDLTSRTPKLVFGDFNEVDIAPVDNENVRMIETQPEINDTVIKFDDLAENEKMKEDLILQDVEPESEFAFENFEESILKPIKDLDGFLNRMAQGNTSEVEIDNYIKIMDENAKFSSAVGFELICKMHKTLLKAFSLLKEKKMPPEPKNAELMRACLIVIVAVVKGKDIDIRSFINKAEEFSRQIQYIN
ncbi:MAG TPA: hypothetical protein VHO28_07775, partial [Ignavibacteriales bacterium]|nr:hypothetical protein [Ignavibacteriales bacterium]